MLVSRAVLLIFHGVPAPNSAHVLGPLPPVLVGCVARPPAVSSGLFQVYGVMVRGMVVAVAKFKERWPGH